MSDSESRISAILAKQAEITAAKEEAIRAQQQAELDETARKAHARQLWEDTLPGLNRLVSDIHSKLSSAGLGLVGIAVKVDPPALGRYEVRLAANERKSVAFHVSAFGRVQPIIPVPHTGKRRSDFNLSDDLTPFGDAILDFVDQAVEEERRALPRRPE